VELLEEGVDDRPDERELPADERLLPADEREPPPDERVLPAELDRGALERLGLLRIEVDERPLGALTDERLPEVEEGDRP
jgi:hypothetical protein